MFVLRIYCHVTLLSIDEYESGEINNLRGAVADANAMYRYLRKQLGVPKAQIVNLRNSQATRDAILSALYDLLEPKRAIRKYDAILIFFAGHGSSCPSPKGWIAGSGRISLISPHDSKMCNKDGEVIHDIPDRTIGAILHKLSRDDDMGKGNNITVILDCCFAGSGTRPNVDPLHLERGFELDYIIPPSLDKDIWEEDSRVIGVVPGFANTGSKSHVLLAACRENQNAREGPHYADEDPHAVGKGPHDAVVRPGHAYHSEQPVATSQHPKITPIRGVFTAALLDHLERVVTDQTTYKELMDGLKEVKGQNPQCEGHNIEFALFKGLIPITPGRQFFPVSQENGQYVVEAGYAHGISDGALFTISAAGKFGNQDGELLATMEASTVKSFRTAVTFFEKQLRSFPARIRALPTSVGVDEALLLHIPNVQGLSNAVRAAYQAELGLTRKGLPPINIVEERRAHLVVQAYMGGQAVEYWLQLPNLIPLSNLAAHRLYRATKAESRLIQPILRAASRFAWHLRRERGHTSMKKNRPGRDGQESNIVIEIFRIEEDWVHGCDEDLHFPVKPVGHNLYRDGRIKVVADGETSYGIHITSNFRVPMHIWAFYFDCGDLSITEYYKPAVLNDQAVPSLPAKGTVALGYGASGGRPYLHYMRDTSQTEDMGFIRLFVSTEYIDLSHIQQRSPFSADDTVVAMDTPRTSMAGRAGPMLPIGKWVKKAEEVVTRNRGATQMAAAPREKNSQGTPLIWDVTTIAVIQTKPISRRVV
ncbi:hypothetical protein PENSPDRAFT_758509 [Peniophora sp. CONT]|nr:hypothetical protein PENSPDRAFT_758509 [Peniophora sp. CONT]